MSLKNRIDSNHSTYYPLNINNEEFSKYGIGLFLYFDFFKKIVFIFFIMSLISLISLLKNIQGNGVDIIYSNFYINKNFDSSLMTIVSSISKDFHWLI